MEGGVEREGRVRNGGGRGVEGEGERGMRDGMGDGVGNGVGDGVGDEGEMEVDV